MTEHEMYSVFSHRSSAAAHTGAIGIGDGQQDRFPRDIALLLIRRQFYEGNKMKLYKKIMQKTFYNSRLPLATASASFRVLVVKTTAVQVRLIGGSIPQSETGAINVESQLVFPKRKNRFLIFGARWNCFFENKNSATTGEAEPTVTKSDVAQQKPQQLKQLIKSTVYCWNHTH